MPYGHCDETTDIDRRGHADVVCELLSGHAHVDSLTNVGNTPLHLSVLAGNIGIVKILIRAGANVNSKTKDGSTPLDFAAKNNHLDIMQLLLKRGGFMTTITMNGLNVLSTACSMDLKITEDCGNFNPSVPNAEISSHEMISKENVSGKTYVLIE